MMKKMNEEKGLTLVELIVIIVLVGILSYVTLMNFSGSSSSIKEKTLARKIVTDIRYAQEAALSHQNTVKCIIEPSQNRYSLKWRDDTYLKTPMAEQDFIVDIDNSDFTGVNLTATKFASGILTFDSKGRPFNGGSPLTTETCLILLNNQVNIVIVPGTGRCYIRD